MTEIKRNIEALFADGRWHQAGEIANAFRVTRQTAHRHLRRLVKEDQLVVDGAGRGTRYRIRSNDLTRSYPTQGLDEDRVWRELSVPGSLLDALPESARSTLNYALTELVNNVVDHSGSETVVVQLLQRGSLVVVDVIDKGVGVFKHIRDRLDLDSELEALQELSKGKTSTMPDRHTGEGIFFTSKAVHEFEIKSGALRWIIDNQRNDTAVGELNPPVDGTSIRLELDTEDVRPLDEVFAEYTEDLVFSKTRTVIYLFTIGTKFVSRSEAKRLLHGLEKFREVVLDFKGVNLVGQGFADEVFRVWALEHPETKLVPIEMNESVEFMVERAIRWSRE